MSYVGKEIIRAGEMSGGGMSYSRPSTAKEQGKLAVHRWKPTGDDK